MTKLYIAPFDCTIFVYKNDEREKFEKAYDVEVGDSFAMTSGSGVWIGEHKDLVGVCYHEAVHLVDWLIEVRLCMKTRSLWDNTELRAYLVEYVGGAIRRFCCDR